MSGRLPSRSQCALVDRSVHKPLSETDLHLLTWPIFFLGDITNLIGGAMAGLLPTMVSFAFFPPRSHASPF